MAETNVSGSDSGAAPTPTASAPATATPVATAPPAQATPSATPQPSATGGAPGEGWVPSYRVRETREAAIREANQGWAAKEQQYQAQLQQIQTQLHALVGVQPPKNPEEAAVRGQFAQLYPGLAQLEERAAQLQDLIDRAGDQEAQTGHYWQTYGRQTMDRLFTHANESLGTPLTDEGKRALHSSFVGFVQSSPELTARYANDPTIVDDFWKAFTSTFIDPARRAAGASVTGRAQVAIPQDVPGGAPHVSQAPKAANIDERAAAAWALYQQNSK